MKRHVGNGRTFYRILVTLLSCVFIMAGFNWALMTYQNRRSVEIHTDMLANAMENGADQIDGFWQNAAAFLASLSDSEQLIRLSNQPMLNLRLSSEAQRAAIRSMASYLASVDCARDTFIYLYKKDYLLTPMGVTQLDTYFNNRYTGSASEFAATLRHLYPFELKQLPFSPREDAQTSYAVSELVLMQTIFGNNQAIGTIVVALDPDALEDTISRSVSIPNCLTYLLLDGVPLNAAYRELAAGLPEGKYSRFIQNVGVVVRRPSDFMSGLEYVAIEDRENVMPESGRILQMLLLLLAAATLGMGVVAFLATRKLYMPLRTLVNEFERPVDARTDECKLLLNFIQSVNSDYITAQHELDYSSPLVRDALLYRLLRDGSQEDDLLVERYLPAPYRQEHFYVFVVAIAFSGDAATENGVSATSLVLSQLKREGAQRLLSVLRTNDEEFALITYPLPAQEHAMLCAAFSHTCARLAKELPGGIVVCAHGAGVAHIDCIDASFREARAIIHSRPITSEYAFLGGPEDEQAKKSDAASLPTDYANTLALLLRGADLEKTWGYVEELLERNRRPEVTAAQYVRIAITLNQQIFWAACSRMPALAERMVEIRPSHGSIPAEQIAGILRENLRTLFQAEPRGLKEDQQGEIMRYVRENISAGVNLSSAAEHFGYNANYFSRYFKQLTGVTFTSYLSRVRIERACQLLNGDGRLSISEIAVQCGYNSAGQFISTFEKLMGLTPGAYRKLPAEERPVAAPEM